MMIHLALSDLPEWSAGAELRRSPMCISRLRFAAMAKTYTDALDGMLPAEPAAGRRASRRRSIRRARPGTARALGAGARPAVA